MVTKQKLDLSKNNKIATVKISAIKKIMTETTDTLVLSVFSDNIKKNKLSLPTALKDLDKSLQDQINHQISLESYQAKNAELLCITTQAKHKFKYILLIGLGSKKEYNNEKARKAAATAIRKATALKSSTVSIEIIDADPLVVREITECLLLAPYNYKKFKTSKTDNKYTGVKTIKLLTTTNTKVLKESVAKAVLSAEGVNQARELIVLPPNELNPAYLAELAKQIGRDNADKGVTVKVLSEKECAKLKMNAFLAVGAGSENESKFIHFNYKPVAKTKTKKALKHICFVGKGVTFDSGGLSLKPPKAMIGMKYDMAGSGAVFGLMSILGQLQPNVEVTAIVAACENMPDGKAFRPGDVITSMSGKTIEILNTDAEGRVTLADAVHYATQQKPDCIIDIATLTGAVVVALGEVCAGIMTNNQDALDNFLQSSQLSGEKMWQLPLYDEHETSIKQNTIADMVNTGSRGQAGSQNGGVFVKQFVNDIPWIHIDIAGSCWPEHWDTCYTPRDNPAGFGVLSFIRHLEQY